MSNPFKTPDGKEKFEQLLKDEKKLVRDRRIAAEVPNSPTTTGIALSGGGIRSATFCLGVLQAISAKGLIPRFDYMSTVSGGSYIGSFFGALFVPPAYRETDSSPPGARPPFDKSKPLQSKLGLEAVRRLRDAGRYLTPSGTSDAFYGAAVVMRNWASVQTVIGLALLLFFWFIRIADAAVRWILGVVSTELPFSPALLAMVWVASVFVFAFASSYWLTRRDWIPASRINRVFSNLYFWMVITLDAFCIYKGLPAFRDFDVSTVSSIELLYLHIAAFLTVSLFAFFYAENFWGVEKTLIGGKSTGNDRSFLIAAEDKVRSKLSDWLATSLIWLLSFSGLFVLDFLGFEVFQGLVALTKTVKSLGNGISLRKFVDLVLDAWPALVAFAPPILSYFARQSLRRRQAEKAAEATGTQLASKLPTLLVLVGSLVVALWIVLWSAGSHAAFPKDKPFEGPALLILAALVAINLGQSLSFSFINLSSLSTFYAARLRRAYLGASSYGNPFTSVRQDDPEDSIRVEDYYKGITENGAPLHLINVTIAETIAGTSNLVARDRKGKPMQLSPSGIVYEGEEPGNFEAGPMHAGEELPLANWISISGAAVSAAIGSGTSLGTSILATMTNVRLGYWWKARHADRAQDLLWASLKDTVQNYLLLELRGAFDGTRRDRWYLTDGGHFENTGIYPLLQRELGFIVACDNGADPSYDMVDILRLVQRARIDLEAHITFLDDASLQKKLGANSPFTGVIGTFQQLAKNGNRDNPGGPIAALAEIRYLKSQKVGTLLLIKPKLTFTEPPELLAYYKRPDGRTFPQQTTGDQFFDEEQWEAYRRLGEFCAEKLFAEPSPRQGGWHPFSLKP